MSDRITYCDVIDKCADCPKYGDDCDGDKRNDDLISRADAIEAVRKELVCDGRHEAHDKTCRFIADVLLSALPSAEAVQGEWVRKYDDKVNCYWYECDQCGEYRPRNQFGHEYNANFCPNCGAKMTPYKGGEE